MNPWGISRWPISSPPVAAGTTAILSGTLTEGSGGGNQDEVEVRTNGLLTVDWTLTNDTWIAAGTGAIGTDAQSLALIQSLDGSVVGGTG